MTTKHPVTTNADASLYELLRPVRSGRYEAYWTGLERHEIVLPWCDGCGRAWHPRVSRCPNGHGRLAQQTMSTHGTVDTFTEVCRPFVPEFAGRAPYVVADVAVSGAGGARLLGLLDPAGREPAVGGRVLAAFHDVHGFGTILTWTMEDES